MAALRTTARQCIESVNPNVVGRITVEMAEVLPLLASHIGTSSSVAVTNMSEKQLIELAYQYSNRRHV